jgi:acyl-CoA synthetase (AMP-forming)/AMP-acid ligase II
MIASLDQSYRNKWRAQGLHAGRTIAQEISHAAKQAPGTTLHFSYGGDLQRATFAEIAEEGPRYARGLADIGLKPGDAIAVQAPYCRDHFLLFAAAMCLGLRYVPIVGIYGSAELGAILDQTKAKAFVAPAAWRNIDFPGRIRGLQSPAALHAVIELGASPGARDYRLPTVRFDELRGRPVPPALVDPNDPAIILFTSGSTGAAKGAIHSHETALAELRAAATFIEQTGRTPVLSPLPTGHVAGVMATLRPFVHLLPAVFLDHWNVERAAQLIVEHDIGWSYGTPFHLSGLLDIVEKGALPKLKCYQIGGAGVPRALIERAQAAGIAACRGYGSTEHPTSTASFPHDPLVKRAGTDGRIMPGVSLKLVADDGREVADGEPGEIVCAGPDQFLGYLDEAHNCDAFDEEGWFRTGDVGVRDADGFIACVDRKKDIIIRAGENIASKEVEDVLMRHPQIAEAAVIGVPDPTYGERVAAVVVLREDGLDLAELKRHFQAAGVAIQKTPERLIIVDDFPRTPVGKIHKGELRRSITQPG